METGALIISIHLLMMEDGHCSLSNNLSENAIRPFTVGRKNWLVSASPKGAASSAIVYTMVKGKKNGKHSCGGDCGHCGGCH